MFKVVGRLGVSWDWDWDLGCIESRKRVSE